ncbi:MULTISPECIES: DUF6506 family protein [Actinomadura]|uniref:DUF6506 family protein n=1 Tax=Actinomadura yumaensis TaxID=111807 RepID=A0ABW2CNM1_9ACTN|nr:DUF6506 family protein [Actinomadura sp. J1-007]MWK36836.1 hypothetical protein [Actinomadura sp. J1-007]
MGSSEAIIYARPGADPYADRYVRENGGSRTVFVPAADPDTAVRVAPSLVADGAERIEVCGGLGPRTSARVAEAVRNGVPVGVCVFGVESIPAAAAFDRSLHEGERVRMALLYREDGADPVADRYAIEAGIVRMLFVPVPDDASAAGAAAALAADEGVTLVELYRGLGPAATAGVIEAVGPGVGVGSVLYAR